MNATEMCGNMEWQRYCEVPFELELMFDASSGSKAAVGGISIQPYISFFQRV